MTNCKVVDKEGIVPSFIGTGDLHVRASFGTAKNLAIDEMLGTLFINGRICLVSPIAGKGVPWYFMQLTEATASTMTISLYTDNTVFHWNKNSTDNVPSEEYQISHAERLVTLAAFSRAEILLTF